MLGDVGNPLAINEDLPPVVEGAEIFGASTQRWEGGRRMRSLQCRHSYTSQLNSEFIKGDLDESTFVRINHWIRCQV